MDVLNQFLLKNMFNHRAEGFSLLSVLSLRLLSLSVVSPVAWVEDGDDELHVIRLSVSRSCWYVLLKLHAYMQRICLHCTVYVLTIICCIHGCKMLNKLFI